MIFKNAKIIPYDEKYREDVENICLKTAGAGAYEDKRKKFLLSTYCDYYIENEKENCFICLDENSGRAVGYILCAPEFFKFFKIFTKRYLKNSLDCGFNNFLEALGAAFVPMLFCMNFPAHLHIDITPEFQRGKVGSELMNCLLNHLKEIGVKGVMLGVSSSNKGAISFYKKCGFKVKISNKSGLTMVKKLN